MIRLSEVERRAREASEGPWEKSVAGVEGDSYVAGTGPWYKVRNGVGFGRNEFDKAEADAAFIAAARTDLSPLAAALRVAVEALDRTGGTLAEVKLRNTPEFMKHVATRVAECAAALARIAETVEVEP